MKARRIRVRSESSTVVRIKKHEVERSSTEEIRARVCHGERSKRKNSVVWHFG
jgi:hypothetical protein